MGKKKSEIMLSSDIQVDENMLFKSISEIIENRKYRAITHTNHETTMMFWET